jgi:hypothetical protein
MLSFLIISIKEFLEFNYLFRDLKTIYYVITIVTKNRYSPDWEALRLRCDWIYRIYTVLNPSESDYGDDKYMLMVKLEERIYKYHRYIDKIGLSDYVKVAKENIKDSDSILLVYYPLLIWINFKNLLILGLIIYLYNKIHFAQISDLFLNIINKYLF